MNKVNKTYAVSCLAVLTLSLSSCELMGPNMREKMPLTDVSTMDYEEPQVVFEQLDNSQKDSQIEHLQAEMYPGSDASVKELNQYAKKQSAKGPGAYSLNFDEADLGEVAKVIISDILGQNYVLSPKVAGQVTLQTTQPLTKDQLIPTLEMLLSMNNAALVKDGGVYHIEPAGDALYTSALSVGGRSRQLPAGYHVSVIPVRNVSVDNISDILKPLVNDKTILHTDSSRNLILAGGTAAELERVKEIVSIFDIDVLRGRSFALFPLAQVDPPTLIEELEHIFGEVSSKDGGGFFRFIPIERMNAILAITHQARYLSDIERWVIRLDKAKTSAGGGVNVYKVQNVDAVALADTLNNIYGFGSSQKKSANVAPGKKSVEVTNKDQQPTKQTIQKASRTAQGIGSGNLGDVRIIADEINNSLVIVATAQEYGVIREVIRQLDVMPLQVLIDATIVDVTLTDELKYGIQWFFNHQNGGQNNIGGGGNFFKGLAADAAKAAATAFTGGFGYSFVSNSDDISAVLSAEAAKGNANVISSPSLMVLNNQEASIQVGEERSLRTSQNTPLSGGIGADNSLVQTSQIQQRKTGVKLKVKPRVNAGGLVIMEIEQSIEDFIEGTADTNGNPNISTREITSSVAIQSGETIVLGGLIKEKNDQGRAGVPILHELPLIGPLFGSTNKKNDKTELVVLITPRVVTTKQDARLVTNEFKRKLTGIYEEIPVYVEKNQQP